MPGSVGRPGRDGGTSKATVRNLIATIRSYCDPDGQVPRELLRDSRPGYRHSLSRSINSFWSADGGDPSRRLWPYWCRAETGISMPLRHRPPFGHARICRIEDVDPRTQGDAYLCASSNKFTIFYRTPYSQGAYPDMCTPCHNAGPKNAELSN